MFFKNNRYQNICNDENFFIPLLPNIRYNEIISFVFGIAN